MTITTQSGENIPLLDTELQVVLEALDAYQPPRLGPDDTIRIRARKKIAQALSIAQRPFLERTNADR
jgi:hypothetical protein